MRDECEHGNLRRSCEICDLKAALAAERKRREEVEAIIAGCNEEERACLEVLNLRKQVAELKDKLPEEMPNRKIFFRSCNVGHGRLIGENWIDPGCPYCKVAALAAAEEKRRQEVIELTIQVNELEAERDRMREALKKALPRMAHRFECVSILPSEMWKQSGSVSLDSCKCEIKIAQAALKEWDHFFPDNGIEPRTIDGHVVFVKKEVQDGRR